MGQSEKRGRQFSKRTVTVNEVEHGTVELWEVRPPRVTLSKIEAIKDEALATIRAAGIEPGPYLEGHGSALRRVVINDNGKDGDSIVGLASRIYEAAAHVEGYRKLNAQDQAIDMMAVLASLVTLFDIYRLTTAVKKSAAEISVRERGPGKGPDILRVSEELERSGKEKHEIANVVARRLEVTPQHARRIVKKGT